MRTAVRIARVLLVLDLVALLAALLGPFGPLVGRLFESMHSVGARAGLGYSFNWYGNLANVIGFVPFTFLLAVSFPRVFWWLWGFVGSALSMCAEATQVFLPPRQPSLEDVISNTIGAFLGAMLGAGVVWVLSRRRRQESVRAMRQA